MRGHRTASPWHAALATVLVLAAAAGVCPAQETPGDVRAWSRWNGWKVTRYDVEGAPSATVGALERGLRGRGTWRLLRGRERPEFAASWLLEDLSRVRLHLARRGYPAARVVPRIVPDEARRSVAVTLEVSPGPAVRVGRLTHEGWPEQEGPPAAVADLPLEPGRLFRDEDLARTEVLLRHHLQDEGYVDARVDARVAPRDSATVDIHLAVTPGAVHTIDAVDVRGCAPDLEDLARRVLDVQPGDRYGRARLAEAAAALRGTQLFRSVELRHEPLGPGSLRLVVELADARMKTLTLSVGTWTDNPWMVRGGWLHRNALGRGRGVEARGILATHRRSLGIGYFWRGWLAPRARTSLTALRDEEFEDAYESREYRIEAVQSFRPGQRSLWNVGVGLGLVDVRTLTPDLDDIPDSEDLLLETWLDRNWDVTDDALYPTRGRYLRTSLTFAPPADPFPASYVMVQMDAAGFVPLGGGLVATGRLRGGWSRPLGDADDLLANRRFYAGGYNSMRGRARRDLGPRDSEGNPRGGQAVALAGAELRARLLGPLDGAAFVDAGQVWRQPSDVRPADVEAAVGVDLDLRTPLGPLRVGHAWLVRAPGADRGSTLWHFGIGYPW